MSNEPATKQTVVVASVVQSDYADALKRRAKQEGRTVSNLIRHILEGAVPVEQCIDVEQRAR